MGIMVGEVTSGTAHVQVRLTTANELVDGDVPGVAGVVEFTLKAADGSGEEIPVQQVAAEESRDFIARATFTDLVAGTQYVCQTRIGFTTESLGSGPEAHFKTLPGVDAATSVKFVVVTGMNYAKFHGDNRIDGKIHLEHNNTELPRPYDGPDKHLGYPGLASILKVAPDFFVGTGDNVYYDTPKEPRAQTVPELRQKWHEQFVQPRYRDLFAKVPTYWKSMTMITGLMMVITRVIMIHPRK